MADVDFPPIFVFVERRYVEPAGSEWREKQCSRYHSYLFPKSRKLSDTIAFAYEQSIALGSEKTAVTLQGEATAIKRKSTITSFFKRLVIRCFIQFRSQPSNMKYLESHKS